MNSHTERFMYEIIPAVAFKCKVGYIIYVFCGFV